MLVHFFYVMIVLKTKISCARKYLKKKKCIWKICLKKENGIPSPFLLSAFRPSCPPPRAPFLGRGSASRWPASPSPLFSPADSPGPPVSISFPNRPPRFPLSLSLSQLNRQAAPRSPTILSSTPRSDKKWAESRAPPSPAQFPSPRFCSHPCARRENHRRDAATSARSRCSEPSSSSFASVSVPRHPLLLRPSLDRCGAP